MAQGGSAAYYRGAAGTNEATGQLRFFQLPTKGTMEWTYNLTHYPVNSSFAVFENGFGVASKVTGNSWGTGGTWTYASTLYPTVSPTELQTTVTDPASVRRVYYFSTPTSTSASGWIGWEYGLPFTARLSNGGKYLSSETFPASGSRIRSTWLTFTHDKLDAFGACRRLVQLQPAGQRSADEVRRRRLPATPIALSAISTASGTSATPPCRGTSTSRRRAPRRRSSTRRAAAMTSI